MIECLVFDLDDTLYPERGYVCDRFAAVADHLVDRFGPIIDFHAELMNCYRRGVRGVIFQKVLNLADICADRTLISNLVELYRQGDLSLKPYPDVRPVLEKWRGAIPLGLVTDGHAPTQRKKLDCLNLAPYFREIVFTGELPPGKAKPSSAAFRIIRRRIGFDGRAAYVGDNPELDVPACRELNWLAVRIVRPDGRYAKVEPPPSCRPDVVVTGLEQLESIDGLSQALTGGDVPGNRAGLRD